MSSSYNPQHHDPTFCPSCGKRKNNFFNNTEEDNNFQDMNTDSFKLDDHSIKRLVMMLITLLNKLEFDKEPKKPHHDCKCNHKHHHDKGDWWKHDDKKNDEHHDKHDCKCKSHKEYDYQDWWKQFKEHYGKHECGCKKHEHYDWWTDEEKHDKYPNKHECECKMKDKKPEKNYHHFELKPNSLESIEDKEMMVVDSSSYEFEYKPKKHHEMPDKIWLADILSLLYNHNLLNLDHLFDQLHKGKQPHKKPTCDCHKEKHWGKEDDHKKDHHEYTKQYYYNGIPLKKIKRKPPYKKDM